MAGAAEPRAEGTHLAGAGATPGARARGGWEAAARPPRPTEAQNEGEKEDQRKSGGGSGGGAVVERQGL